MIRAMPPPLTDPDARQYLTDCAIAGHRPDTLRLRRAVLADCAATTGPLLTAAPDALAAWYGRYAQHSLATRNTYGRAVRAFYTWAGRRGLLTDGNPALALPIPKPQPGQPRPIPVPELRAACDLADPRVRLWLTLAAAAGMRAGEISRMRREDLDGRLLRIPEGKGGRPRTVPVGQHLAGMIAAWRTGPGRMWRVGPTMVSAACGAALRAAGSTSTLHACRHLYGTTWYRASRDLLSTQRALGHASPATTQIYALPDPASAAAAVAAVDQYAA